MLEGAAPHCPGPISSKAVGEPPLLLAASVAAALQRATAAALRRLCSLKQAQQACVVAGEGSTATATASTAAAEDGDTSPTSVATACLGALDLPATTARVQAACGGWRGEDVLRLLHATAGCNEA